MGGVSKSFSLLLIVLLAVSSIIMAKPAFAQTPTPTPTPIPTPSVPQFTVQLVGPSYTVPTTYSLNQSSGQVVANIGYTNEYSCIAVIIKNQPLVFDYNNTHLVGAFGFYYNIQTQPHHAPGTGYSWDDLYSAYEDDYPTPSDSEYTNISIPFSGGESLVVSQIDIQVQAMMGSVGRVYNPNADGNQLDMYPWEFEGVTSAWSATQTVTIPASIPLSPTPAPSSSTVTPTPTPTLTSVSSASYASLLLIALVVIAFLLVVIIFLLLYMRKRRIAFSQTKVTPTT